ncbi:UDP-N-acetylmuramoyl-tripeptide--D-alanyl-D-alanine ligase [Planctomycetes bacterium LzC2]|uniref:UDP-N-acetylmuramoyl-tripeptide--D-alanyl-D-alanine ligase n=1 Tax=Alienimonas chondri TaxID=2681879 RepID=A0ABX1V7Y6_9PLAN|nr:UDP-N-acetylmuramoyl-tripeptide--D-alanyl-D-alanine ligase [Alienimonas chondri]
MFRNAEAPRSLGVTRGTQVGGAAIDSRAVRPGDLFFALPGARTDGHDYVADAFHRGAVAAVVAQETDAGPAIVVPDPAAALAQLGAWNRDQCAGPVVAVGGSHGKTTCRDLLHAALSGLGPGVRSRANFNNALGVPLTLCEIAPEHRSAVIEVGASSPGEIATLCEWAKPTAGVLTGVGTAHVGTFGGPAALRAAKAELFAGVAPDGVLVVNRDDPGARALAQTAERPIVVAGTTADCDVRVEPLPAPPGFLRFGRNGTTFSLQGFAPHFVSLGACAVAVGEALGLSNEAIRNGLTRFRPPPGRGAVTVVGGATFIDDTYNAPPEGFFAAVDLLASWPVVPPGRRWLVCGGMRELGEEADRLYAKLGRRIATAGLDRVLFVGATGARTADAAGLSEAVGIRVRDASAAAAVLSEEIRPGDVALAKGCRADGLERVIAAGIAAFS